MLPSDTSVNLICYPSLVNLISTPEGMICAFMSVCEHSGTRILLRSEYNAHLEHPGKIGCNMKGGLKGAEGMRKPSNISMNSLRKTQRENTERKCRE